MPVGRPLNCVELYDQAFTIWASARLLLFEGGARLWRGAFLGLGGAPSPYAYGARETRTCSSKVALCALQKHGVSEASVEQDPWVAKVEHFGPSGGTLGRSKMHFFGLWPFGPKTGPGPKKRGVLSLLFCVYAQHDPPKRAPGPLRRGVKSVTFFEPKASACEKRMRPLCDTPIF